MHRVSEKETRKELIDPALERAGWYLRDHSRVRTEIPVDGYEAEPWNGVTDYCLYRPNGEVMAVVEAKRATYDPRLAEAQAEHYVIEIEKHQSFRPFAFLTDGIDIYFMDVGLSAKRLVSGFFTPTDLDNLLFIRQNGKPLGSLPIDNRITDRSNQHEAVRRVSEAFEQGWRKALIVMATGSGKTRTTMSLIDVFLRANQARKVLFVAHQFRDQLDDLSKGSTLNVGNLIVFRVTGRDSYALASQFDNTPPPPDTRVEPIYREYEFQGVEALIETRLNTGEGKLYQDVELPRRPYSDVEAETANCLSILPNFEAMCHLIHIPDGGKRPSLVEHHIVTEVLGEQ